MKIVKVPYLPYFGDFEYELQFDKFLNFEAYATLNGIENLKNMTFINKTLKKEHATS